MVEGLLRFPCLARLVPDMPDTPIVGAGSCACPFWATTWGCPYNCYFVKFQLPLG
jgi:hypothetical protein